MTKKLKLPFVIASTTLLVAAPTALVVSCSNEDTHANLYNTYLVTDGGNINDNSINEMAADALATILNVDSISSSDYIKPGKDITSAYKSLEKRGAKIVLAAGSNQAKAINNYFIANPNSELKFVLIDGDYSTQNFVKPDKVASIKFDVRQPAFLAGVLASKYLTSINDKNPKVGMFSDNNNVMSTDYMLGFASGIKFVNDQNSGDTDVQFVTFSDDKSYTDGNIEENMNALFRNQVDVILPVVDNKMASVIDAIKSSYDAMDNKTRVIGTEIDQSTEFPQDDQGMFLTSIEKKVHKGTFDVVRKIINSDPNNKMPIAGPIISNPAINGSIKGFGELTVGDLNNSFVKLSTPKTAGVDDIYKDVIGVNYGSVTNPKTYLNAAKVESNYFTDFDATLAYINSL